MNLKDKKIQIFVQNMGFLKAVFLIGFLVLLPAFCTSESEAEVVTIDVHEARKILNQGLGYIYLDVRTKEEFKNGHVENALNIPYMFNTPKGMVKNPKFIDQVMSLCGKEDHLIVVDSVFSPTNACSFNGDCLEREMRNEGDCYSNIQFNDFNKGMQPASNLFIEAMYMPIRQITGIPNGCKSGVRSANAIIDLLNAEFKHVYNMGGGHIAWIENGFPINKPHIEEL